MSQVEKFQEQIKFLNEGEVMAVYAERVGENKDVFSVVFRQKRAGFSLLNITMASHEKFSGGSVRLGRHNFTQKELELHLGVDLSKIKSEKVTYKNGKTVDVYPLGVMNPSVSYGTKKYPLSIRRIETTEPTEWERLNMDKSVKQNGKGDFYFTEVVNQETGETKTLPIFGRYEVVAQNEPDVLITENVIIRKTFLDDIELSTPFSVEESVI